MKDKKVQYNKYALDPKAVKKEFQAKSKSPRLAEKIAIEARRISTMSVEKALRKINI